jgi:tetratricopeptide (TPR) repeat protein
VVILHFIPLRCCFGPPPTTNIFGILSGIINILGDKIMSSVAEESDVVCANCGHDIAEVDEIKLEECDGCDLVRYCGDKCREEHREQHNEECKKRAKESQDNSLFRQPDGSHRGECPLCFLPMPLDPRKSTFNSCCSKHICDGCEYAHHVKSGSQTCPFCRESLADDDDEEERRLMKRIKANDPAALRYMGTERYFEGDHDTAVKYWTKAAELGDMEAHCNLGESYHEGDVVVKDEEKGVYHLEMAAIGGDPDARHYLAVIEERNGNVKRAVKHFIIAANLGYEESMKALWKHYSAGNITKEDLEATLRTHKAATDAMKSPEREAAEAWLQSDAHKG